jgi:hypothetical protein
MMLNLGWRLPLFGVVIIFLVLNVMDVCYYSYMIC